MKTANIIKAVCAAGLAASCVWGLAGCSSGSANASSGGTAATVNGTEIPEDKVTSMIETIRAQSGLVDADTWGQWLADNSMTPDSIRQEMIDSFAQEELMKQGAKEKGITVESSEIDSVVDQMKTNFENDEKWQQALTQAGFTEDEYRSQIETQLLQKKVTESFAPTEEPTEADLLQYSQMYASAYDGAKRSSHILFDSNDQATAQSVLDQINAGTLDFAEAAKQYSKDSGSAAKGGDVGWDKLSNFVTEYTTALSGLEKDKVSGLVQSQYGYHIIKCTDVFTAPKVKGEDGKETVQITSITQIPTEFLDNVKSSLKQQKQTEGFQAWLDELKEKADIQTNPMPENLPYWIDMSKYQPSTNTDSTSGNTSGGTNADSGSTSGGSSSGTGTDATANSGDTAKSGEGNSAQPAEAA